MAKYKYLITGKRGLIGSSLVRLFKKESLPFLSISRKDLNLLDYEKTTDFFKEHNFDIQSLGKNILRAETAAICAINNINLFINSTQ